MSNTSNTPTSRLKDLTSLRNKFQAMSTPGYRKTGDEEKYWKPELDKLGTGSAIIRFLHNKLGEDSPTVKLFTHGFQKVPNGKKSDPWYIKNCPTSLEQDYCPACKGNNELWEAGGGNKESPECKLASYRKRKLNYISNILVVNDPKHPENNGKVFLYKYGSKIWDKIIDMINPAPEFNITPMNPFDPEEGANFLLRVVKVDGWPNYDKSAFDVVSSIAPEILATLESNLHSLNGILDPKNFESVAELTKRYNAVVGEKSTPATDTATAAPKAQRTTEAKPVGRTAPAPEPPASDPDTSTDDDFFARLAQQPSV